MFLGLGNMPSEFLGVAPWVIVTAILSWIGSAFANREKAKKYAIEHADRLEMHRDDLTLQIISRGREELALARIEVSDMREEVRKLRAMETHFFHFQQSLDHLEALLTASTTEERMVAERNARAFLTRMRRLNEAKGTITNEVQRMASEISILDQNQNRDPRNA
jgi:hypothetical protein